MKRAISILINISAAIGFLSIIAAWTWAVTFAYTGEFSPLPKSLWAYSEIWAFPFVLFLALKITHHYLKVRRVKAGPNQSPQPTRLTGG